MRLLFPCLLAVGLCAPSRALAEETRSYAVPVIAVDATFAAAIATSMLTFDAHESWTWPVLATAGFALGAPIVHLAHDRPLAALGSLGLRAVLPATLAYALAGGQSCRGDVPGRETLCTTELAIGFAIGTALATTLDATLLARETVRSAQPERPGAPRETRPVETISPMGYPTRGGGVVGLTGVF